MKTDKEIIEALKAGCALAKIAGEKLDPDLILMNLELIGGQEQTQVIKGVSSAGVACGHWIG